MVERSHKPVLRCAIYTRKSSEEGLEQDFNSLQAQREACKAFITSQKHEGWKAILTRYDDGGYSGGSMERPALHKLLADIQAKLIDVVVVYKVDRLTRSLADFAKIVEVFDANGVSFVSVTQQFNTTTSMGRLTLNVLLSFAQFEREVTGERIRDKIAASKKKGMWMGGWVPIGYDLKDRSLLINKSEAETVRTIFRLYLERGNVRLVQAELERRKLTTKRYVTTTGRKIGGLPFRRGHIYWILSNPLYVGDIGHKGARHRGQHPKIIDRKVWDAVQAKLKANGHKHRNRSAHNGGNLFAGLIFDDKGNRLTPTHTKKSGKRYRYYALLKSDERSAKGSDSPHLRVSAPEIEALVIGRIKALFAEPKQLIERLRLGKTRPAVLRTVIASAKKLAAAIETSHTAECHTILGEIVARIVVCPDTVQIELKRRGLLGRLAAGISKFADGARDQQIVVEIATSDASRRSTTSLVIEGTANPNTSNYNPTLAKAIARGHVWFDELQSGRAISITQIARREGVTDRYVSQLLSLAFLPPSIVDRFIAENQPRNITLKRLMLEDDSLWNL